MSKRGGEGASWSPDGRWIAFDSHPPDSGQWDIWVMRADGSDERRLTGSPAVDYVGAWSADDSRLLFSSDRSGNSEVYVMDADGTDQKRLTTMPDRAQAPAVWLPDGRIVFASSPPEGPPDWFVMDADGRNIIALPQLKGAGDPLDWTAR